MLFLAASFVVAAVAAAFFAYRALRPRLDLSARPQLIGRAMGRLFGEPTGSMRGQPYISDAGELTRTIIHGMVKLGYQAFTSPTRVLDPRVVVIGAEADIDTLRHFDAEVRTEIINYVKQKGAKFRWSLPTPPTLTYRTDPEAVPGCLSILRAASLTVAEPAASPLTTGPRSEYRPADGEGTGSGALSGPAADRASTRYVNSRSVQPAGAPGRPGPTRLVSGRSATTNSGTVCLFRVGGGNVYHLKAGLNRLGRDPGASDIVCAYDDAISNIHLEFEVAGTEVKVRDAGSLNGTNINGRDLLGTQALHHGDELRVGQTKLRLVVGNASLAPTQPVTAE